MKRTVMILAALLTCSIGLQAQKYVGGDISLLPKYEEAGVVYRNADGQAVSDVLAFFSEEGLNAMRV